MPIPPGSPELSPGAPVSPVLRFSYQNVKSVVTKLFTRIPMITCRVGKLDQPTEIAANLRLRIDTGANLSAVPMQVAAEVLDLFPHGKAPTDQELRFELFQRCKSQGFNEVKLRSVSGQLHRAYPLWVPVELSDDRGQIAEFEALIAFTEGQHQQSLLAGLTGFLDKFIVTLRPSYFELQAITGSGVRWKNPTSQ